MDSIVGVASEHFGVFRAWIWGAAETAVVPGVVPRRVPDAVDGPAVGILAYGRVALCRTANFQALHAFNRSIAVLHAILLPLGS